MDISNISAIDSLSAVSRYGSTTDRTEKTADGSSFENLLASAMNLVGETNQLSNAAEAEEVRYAMGESDNLHALQVAQQKANVSLQYTVAVKNTAMEAYRTLLNLQF